MYTYVTKHFDYVCHDQCVGVYVCAFIWLRRFRFVQKLCDVTLNDLRPFRLFACGCMPCTCVQTLQNAEYLNESILL